ncbi:lysozyme inhibitor LprI family protein [Xanthobacter agilis]|uniref:Uncharacterized protein YecT (DUF1311 family) n=1 Tax=Xanthobacter agilis TaxID=47492 RepID=A0ABU0LDS5_XANAG|nr:lysozyme inhibitor LprI family protein [Xanthobacter agilis]MDQ0505215.1 uncharacterized protein YecT (DUF1311 family) [Xanthobacter agilis]
MTEHRGASDRNRPRRARPRWGLGLLALALAVSPAALLVSRPVAPEPGASLFPGPVVLTPPGAAPAARAEAGSPPVLRALEHTLDHTLDSVSPVVEASTSAALCPPDQIAATARSHCLYEAIRTSEQALEAEVANAMRVIAARSDLAPVQRNRWTELLDEAQSRFLLFRNFDCQSVAPFEGRRGIGNFEERALCLITANMRRAEALAARYPQPSTPSTAAAPDGPQPRPGIWTHQSPPELE